jgi:hypothetical protein
MTHGANFHPVATPQQLGELVLKWQDLKHSNVLPCLGLTKQFGPIPALIFLLCTEGSIM